MWQLLGHINAVYIGTWLLLLRQRCTKSRQCICHSQTSETNILISMKTGQVRLWLWGFTLRNKQVEHKLKGKANAIVTPSPKVKSCKAISIESEESFVLLTWWWIVPLALWWQLKSQGHWCDCSDPLRSVMPCQMSAERAPIHEFRRPMGMFCRIRCPVA